MNGNKTSSGTVLRIARGAMVAALVIAFGVDCADAQRRRRRLFPRADRDDKAPVAPADIPTPRLVASSGGRVAWYHGGKHELIAYDAVSNDKNKNSEVYVMNPDGSGRRCVTCDSSVPKGFVGQPEWHPDGDHLIIQVENKNSGHRFYNHMSWGIDNDFWIINKDGSGARKIWDTPKGNAALHPHFSDDGSMLMFSERVPTGKSVPALRRITPNGENHWMGWRIHLANVNIKADGPSVLTNHRSVLPSGEGFYETHEFLDGGRRLLYSHTDSGQPYVDDVYVADLDGKGARNLTNSPSSWDEHGLYSSRGDFAFMSSRFDRDLSFPRSKAAQLRTELFVQKKGGVPVQVTDMNARKGKRMCVSDYDWDRDGRRIVFQVAVLDASVNPELWMIDVK